MRQTIQLKGEPRTLYGSANAKRLRQQNLLPGVVYGHKEVHLDIVLPRDEVEKAVRKGAHIVDLEAGGKTETVRFRELQWDNLGKELVHVDLMRVSKDERIVVPVRIELRGTAPGVGEGGVVDQPIHVLNVECPVFEIPENIRVMVDKLHIGDAIHVKELVLPANVVAKADPDAVVVHVKAHKEEAAPAPVGAVPAAEGAAEPEVIKKAPKPEEPEE